MCIKNQSINNMFKYVNMYVHNNNYILVMDLFQYSLQYIIFINVHTLYISTYQPR